MYSPHVGATRPVKTIALVIMDGSPLLYMASFLQTYKAGQFYTIFAHIQIMEGVEVVWQKIKHDA